jgi:hypothetical protein
MAKTHRRGRKGARKTARRGGGLMSFLGFGQQPVNSSNYQSQGTGTGQFMPDSQYDVVSPMQQQRRQLVPTAANYGQGQVIPGYLNTRGNNVVQNPMQPTIPSDYTGGRMRKNSRRKVRRGGGVASMATKVGGRRCKKHRKH